MCRHYCNFYVHNPNQCNATWDKVIEIHNRIYNETCRVMPSVDKAICWVQRLCFNTSRISPNLLITTLPIFYCCLWYSTFESLLLNLNIQYIPNRHHVATAPTPSGHYIIYFASSISYHSFSIFSLSYFNMIHVKLFSHTQFNSKWYNTLCGW